MGDASEFEWGVSGPLFAGFTIGELRDLEDLGWRPKVARMKPENHPEMPSVERCEHEWRRIRDVTEHSDTVVVYRDDVDPNDSPQISFAIDCDADEHPTEVDR